ncbi:bifunctional 23S rRNA (guanine(2069)-N(7))-methyltransferase RlmK/23S rRNA (guanine(2445)-N(2))-methyltransferase RlmL [Kaarinaea lacus]
MSGQQPFFATAPKGMEGLLANELRDLGAGDVGESRSGVVFHGDLSTAYRVCLWSRIANRVLYPLATFSAADEDALYNGVFTIDWSAHLEADGTIAVDFTSVRSAITHTRFGAQKVKDAIVDQFRQETGERPSVERDRPDVRINVFLYRDQATVYLDLSGDSLHRRGYRLEGGGAPLKENLAAAILVRAGWPEIAAEGGALVDPMCGSGTLPIEAAMMALDIAPGLLRDYWGFLGWKQHDAGIWSDLVTDARERCNRGLEKRLVIRGFDVSARAIDIARDNAAAIGLEKHIEFSQRAIRDCAPAPDVAMGLVVVNPPYGERLGEHEELKPLYSELGDCLKSSYQGWRASVITSDPELGKCMGIRARQINKVYNGALECILLRLEIDPRWFMKAPQDRAREPGAEMFANRLRKNLKQLAKWRKQESISCFRCYDADMPEYAFAVDVYDTFSANKEQPEQERWVVVQEYAAPSSVDARKVRSRREQAMAVIPEVFEVPGERVVFKLRERKRGTSQYEKQQATRQFHVVEEGPCRLWVNFEDYLDTGLFLDHRQTRQMIGKLADRRRFLNLFAYTGAATVHAAIGGATTTTTVDMSRTYLDIARRNMALNGFRGDQHQFEQADCLMWIEKALIKGLKFGLIFLDPPTFSTSKRMDSTLDIQRDHVELIQKTAALLEPDGILVFSTNYRRFKMDVASLTNLEVEDITSQTIPRDFERNRKIHQCWRISRGK